MTVPDGYTALATGARRAIVRDDLVCVLGPWLLRAPLGAPVGAMPIDGGREAAFRLRLPDGAAAVARLGRRGGVVALVVRDRYVGVRPRPWRELGVSVAARRRGAPVPEVLAVAVHGWASYRSVVVTGEIAGAAPAMTALRAAAGTAHRIDVARAAGTAVARLHAAGVLHPDLNASNIVVAGDAAAVVDLDRARIRPDGLRQATRLRSLRRLARSVRKLDPGGAVVDEAVRAAFHAAYAGREGACAS